MSWYSLKAMPRARILALLGGLLLASAFLISAIPLEKKYSLKGFSSLRWELYPPDAKCAEFGEKECTVTNDSSQTVLVIGPYEEENLELGVTIHFAPTHEGGCVGVIFNVQPDYAKGERPTYMVCRVSSHGEVLFAAVHSGTQYPISHGRFTLNREHPRVVRVDLLKRRERVELTVNGQERVLVDETPLPPGGFGFLLAPGTEVKLTDLYFAKYGEVDYLFKGVDVEKLFGRK